LSEILSASEDMIGIGGFISGSDALGGKLRVELDDFIVEEVIHDGAIARIESGLPDAVQRDVPGGEYSHFVMEKRGIDVYQAIRELARILGVSRKRFSYSGTKDAKAVTSQLVSISRMEPEELVYDSPRVKIRTPFRANSELRFGDHWGNSFKIRIREIPADPTGADRIAANISAEIRESGGVPNFFGHQRFGTLRSNTHIVGKLLLSGDFEAAVWEFLSSAYEGETQDAIDFRTNLGETMDIVTGLSMCPSRLSYERILLQHLSKSPRDFLGALRLLPRDLLSIFVRAYQSYIFNLVLSRRLESEKPFEPRTGDIIEVESSDRRVVGESISLGDADSLQADDRGRIEYSLVGYASGAEGPVSDEVMGMMGEMGIGSSFFYIRQMPDISPRGSYRSIRCRVHDLSIKSARTAGDRASMDLSFRLEKGCYATAVLREYMKAGICSY
jgi:tRNA pseudouridine13 synthase